MKKRITKLLTLLLVFVSIFSMFSFTTEASNDFSTYEKDGYLVRARKNELTAKTVLNKDVGLYRKINITVNDKNIGTHGLLINDTTYVPLRGFISAIVYADIRYDAKTKTADIKADGLVMSANDGGYVIYANGRTLYTMTPTVVMSDGKMYAPIRPLAKSLGVNVGWDQNSYTAKISGGYSPILSGDYYYNKDDLYWLSRIINAESRGEPLIGQIAVGNVVLNRMRSSSYPNSIYGVIFDKKHGVQFSPVLDGTIYMTPTSVATVAAKICLEGTSVTPDALFFLAPKYAQSSWIVNNRKYIFTIGGHDFYA